MSFFILDTIVSKLQNDYSILFDGVNEYITVADHASIDFDNTSAFSISAWVKRTATGIGQVIVGKREGAPNFRGYQLTFTNTDLLELDLLNTATNRLRMVTTSTFSAGIWYHVVATYDGSQTPGGVKIYKNGVSDTLTTTMNALTATLLNNELLDIGATVGGTIPFNGNIDEVSLWNAQLTAAQILEIYNNGRPKNLLKHSANGNLISYFRMGDNDTWDGTNWTLVDRKGTNNGTSVNMEQADRELNTPI